MKFPRLSKGSTGKRILMIQYLTETLGLRYIPQPQLENPVAEAEVVSAWSEPTPAARLIFVLTDLQDAQWSNAHETVFQNMIKALGLTVDQVHKVGPVEVSLVDYFSRLRTWNCQLPTVFLSMTPDSSTGVKSLGSHNWVEIYSFTEMMKKPDLKKISWKTLQALQAQGL